MNPDPPFTPELLAPAGNQECLVAAIENGADAVYFGLDHGFNARARAGNFSMEELPGVMQKLHRHGLCGYVTLNTLVFSHELPAMAETVARVAEAGVDAVLVQDLGVARMVKSIAPNLSIHASTQMTLTCAEGIAAVQDLGLDRVVLPRELSLSEIQKIGQTSSMPLEVFVHGALCVAYSGQCLTSESLGGRSANRGQCAQACRLPYELICDGEDVDLDQVRYLLSPQDLAAYDLIPELIQAGVCSFKIEGRLKTAEYVANITSHYRQAIDEALRGQPHHFSEDEVREMELSFSRGFSHGWLEGCDHKALVPGLSSAKRGILAGTVHSIRGNRLLVNLACPVAAGDGLVFESNRERDEEQGGRLYEVLIRGKRIEGTVRNGTVELRFERQRIDTSKLKVGQRIWKTDDPKLTKRWRKSFTQADTRKRLPLRIEVQAQVGKPLRLVAQTPQGHQVHLSTEQELQEARKHPLSVETLEQQLGRLGATTFELTHLEAEIVGRPMVPLSVLGQLRHQMIADLEQALAQPSAAALRQDAWRDLLPTKSNPLEASAPTSNAAQLIPLCRTLDQLEMALEAHAPDIYVDFQDIRQYREAVARSSTGPAHLWLAPTRIQKPKEFGLIRKVADYGAFGLLARNLSTIQYCQDQGIPFVSDFSLNPTNELTVDYLRQRGAHRIAASYDMNRDQLIQLVQETDVQGLEVVIHQHMPMFHMEHCVFCSLLSPGTNKTNCGRPCDDHEVKLRDRVGREHPLKADIGCRNTLFNATPQSAAEAVHDLIQAGVRSFRIEFLDQDARQSREIWDLYQKLLAGDVTGAAVWQSLKASNRVGVTRGTLEEPRHPLAIL
jgi:putative protease